MRKVLYREVQAILEQRIVQSEYPLHTFLPSEKKLSEEFDVSLITVRRAIENLSLEGYVKKRVAKGAEVVSLAPLSTITRMGKFSSLLKRRGEKLTKLQGVLTIVENTDRFEFKEAGSVYQFTRLYKLNDEPYILESHYFPQWMGEKIGLDKLRADDSLYYTIYNAGFQFERLVDEFKAVALTSEMKEQLQTSETIGLMRVRNGYDEKGNLVHRMESVYNTAVSPYLVEWNMQYEQTNA